MQLNEEKKQRMKRLDVVSLKMVKECTFPYSINTIRSPKDAAELARQFIGDADREICGLIGLDTKNKINGIHIVSIGSLNASIVHPREVLKYCVLANCASYVLFHNHPSGCCASPSPEDCTITDRLKQASEIMGIEILDHLILGESNHYSMKEHGHL